MEKEIILEAEEIKRTLSRMGHEIVEKNGGVEDLILIGIRSRGAYLAQRIARRIESSNRPAPPCGAVDVTPWRDDVTRSDVSSEALSSRVPFSIDDRTVVLIDDVIYTGRTIRAAFELINHLGRPKKILLAILVDRGDRELPIKPDIVGKNVKVRDSQRVNVLLQESDGIDRITVTEQRQRPYV